MSKFYNWFHKYYEPIERTTSSIAKEAVTELFESIKKINEKTALEYACGTGALTKHLSKYFKNVTAKDTSIGMLENAKINASLEKGNIDFRIGNILAISEKANEYDWAFISFALHLFSPENEKRIITKLLEVAREGVVVIDHRRKWGLFTALAEWIEGSHYSEYLRMDFRSIAASCNVREYNELNGSRYFAIVFMK